MKMEEIKGWIPYEIVQEGTDEWKAKWLFLGEHLFLEPFFEQTIGICRGLPLNRKPEKVITSLDFMETASQQLETIPPTAFIFHISRCGSTLLTQLLSLRNENIAVSEAPIFDSILRLKYNAENIVDNTRLSYLKHAVRLMGQKRFDNQRHYFIKWDSWHLFFLDEIRHIFPDTPFIFMTRATKKVLHSHQKVPGMQAVRGMVEPAMFGSTLDEVLLMQPDDYIEYIVSKMCQATEDYLKKDNNCLLLQYETGVLLNFINVLDYLNLKFSEKDMQKVENRLMYHSKKPFEKMVLEP